jgi:hypothetical protein
MDSVKVGGERGREGEMKAFLSPCIWLFIVVVEDGETKIGSFVKERLK